MAKKLKTPQYIPEVVVPLLYVPQTPITEEQKRTMYVEACAYWKEVSQYYGYDGDKPPNVQQRFQSILGAVDLEKAELALKKARGAALMCLLAAWARGSIIGPNTPETWDKKAKIALSLAKMLEGQDHLSAARVQYDKAEAFSQRALTLRKTST